jgi:AAA family ATP:ADP antiporter
MWTGLATLGTLACYAVLGRGGHIGETGVIGLYVLYVWSGVIAAQVLVRFWSQMGEALSVTQAKRLYPLIGAGSVVGALLGSGLATWLARTLGPEQMLLGSTLGFGVSCALASLLSFEVPVAGLAPPGEPPHSGVSHESGIELAPAAAASGGVDAGLMNDTRLAARHPYVRRIALLVLASSGCLTVADYVFKSSVAASVPSEQLGMFFGSVALALNLLSLPCQLALGPWLLKRFDVGTALAVLPSLLIAGGAALAAGFGLGASLFIKSSDGALRYSLHRTGSELLYVPLADRARPRIKALLDVLGQRVGQASASLAILGLTALGAAPWVLAAMLVLLAAVWAGSALNLRRHYVDLLRSGLAAGAAARQAAFPQLDVASLETLMAALDSQSDNEVLAALDVIERESKAHLVPALILHHPSEQVVERALALFTRSRRSNVMPIIDRLLDHPGDGPRVARSLRVRAAAIAARYLLVPDARWLYLRLNLEESPEVRAVIMVHLIASGELVGAEARQRLKAILNSGSSSTKIALIEAIAWRAEHKFDDVLGELAQAPEIDVRLAATAAMIDHPSESYVPALVRALGDECTRNAARRALVAQPRAGFKAMQAALADDSLPQVVRWELPRTLGMFDPQDAADALLKHLSREGDGMVRYRIIRALETVQAREPTVSLDRGALDGAISQTVQRAYRHLDARLSLERGSPGGIDPKTPGQGLLLHVLRDKERNAGDRLLRLLGLAHPTADLAKIRRGLRSNAAKTRASCVELISSLLQLPLRAAVLGLIDELPDAERLALPGPFYSPARRSYEQLLEQLLGSESEALQDITAFHVAELGLSQFRPQIARLAAAASTRADLTTSLARLDGIEEVAAS